MLRVVQTFLIVLITFAVQAKDGYEIKIELTDFDKTELYLGYHYGDKQYIQDTVQMSKKGQFVFSGEEALKPGVYLVILPPDNQYLQVLVNEDNQHFTISTSALNLVAEMKIKGSEDNQLFYDYMTFLNKKKPEVEGLKKQLETADGKAAEKLQANMEKVNAEVAKYQQDLMKDHSASLTASIVRANQETKIPDFEGDEQEQQKQRYLFYKTHYFDNVDLADPRMLRSPVLHQRVNYYIEKLTPQLPDSISVSLDYLLGKMEPSEETFKYYLVHFINKYAKAKIVGMDAVYVHLVENYYGKGKAPWTDEEQLKKMTDNAKTLKPILIGKIAPDIKMFKEDKTPLSLHEVDALLTVLFFWDPECGHCKKSMPQMIEFYNSYKEKGVEMFAVCTKLGAKGDDCWKFVEEKEMGVWINVNDPQLSSRFKQIYDIRTTPRIFVLDHDKEILTKRIGSEQLPEVLDAILAQKAKEAEAAATKE